MNIEELKSLVEREDKRLTVADAREYFKGCIPGWKLFSESNGFDWIDVTRHGLLASQLLTTNDSMATNLVTYVYLRDKR